MAANLQRNSFISAFQPTSPCPSDLFSSPEPMDTCSAETTSPELNFLNPPLPVSPTSANLTSSSFSDYFSSPEPATTPAPPLATQPSYFEISARVFLLDPTTGNSMNPSPITLGNGCGFDNNAVVTLLSGQVVSAENTPDASTHDVPIPMVVGVRAYHYEAPGVFLVHRRYARVRQGNGRAVRVRAERVEGHEGAERESAYHIIPEKGVGKGQVVLGRRLVQVRFRPGDWAWYSPLPIDQEEEGGCGSGEIDEVDSGINGQKTEKEKALIIGADVVGMKRIYRIHLVNSQCDMPVVPDGRLEEVAEDEYMFL